MSKANVELSMVEMVVLAQGGDRNMANLVVKAHLWIVKGTCRKYLNYGAAYDDLFQEGCIGLMKAMEKFQPARGYQFSTYAGWWVRQKVQRMAWGTKRKAAVSLDQAVGADTETLAIDLLVDKKSLAAFDEGEDRRAVSGAMVALSLLTPKESRAMELRFGLKAPTKTETPESIMMAKLAAKYLRAKKAA